MSTSDGSSIPQWFGVRCLFREGEDRSWSPSEAASNANLYEERITIWTASSFDEAIERAEADAVEYAETIGWDYLGLAQAYEMGDAPGDGAEVFSLLRESELAPTGYLDEFFDTGTERQGQVDGG